MYRRDIKYFELAKDISKLSDYKNIKIGCVIVDGKDIISVGYNHKKSHPLQKKLNYLRFTEQKERCHHYIHAEMSAIISAKQANLSNARLYIYRANKDGMQMCRPCEACMSAIKSVGIKTIYYTTIDGYCREELI